MAKTRKKLKPGDYLAPQDLMVRERAARTMQEQDYGVKFLCYAYSTPGSNPLMHGYDVDPQARAVSMDRTAVLAEIGRIFNPQMQVSMAKLNRRVMTELFPDGVEWANLEPGDSMDVDAKLQLDSEALAERAEQREDTIAKLEPIQRLMFQDVHRSNFSEQAPEALMDAKITRIGVMTARRVPTGEGPSLVSFQHVSSPECAFDWSPHGDCWGVYRRHWLTKEECEFLWPDGDGWTFPEKDGEAGHKARSAFTEAAYRVHGKKVWAYQVVQEDSELDVVEREYKRNPYIVFGFNCAPGARLGRSIAEQALPTARSLNQMTRIAMEAAEFRSIPSYTVARGGMTPLQVQRGIGVSQLIPVQTNDRNTPSLAPLEVAGDVNLAWTTSEQMEMQIKQICLDQSLPEPQAQPMTARELMARQREMRNELGTIYTRIMNHLGRQVLQHFLDALYEAGDTEGMNREGGEVSAIEIDGQEVKVTFNNPLAQAQKMTDVEDVIGGIETLNSVMDREMVNAALHLEKLPEWMGKQMSSPEMLYRKEQQRQSLANTAVQSMMMGAGQGAGSTGGPRAGAGGSGMMGGMPSPNVPT